MAYSSVAQLRLNVPRIEVAILSDVAVDARIALADSNIQVDLSNVVDFTLVTDTPAGAPTVINVLSQYKTAELSLVAVFSSKRMTVEMNDWEYWQKLYDKLIEAVLDGTIDIADIDDGTGTFSTANYPKATIEPALGQGENGEWVDDDDLETIRAKYGNQE